MTNTGYKINYLKDINPYSPTFGNVKTERIYDIITCPLSVNGNITYKVNIPSNNFTDNDAIGKPYLVTSPNRGYELLVDWGDGNVETINKTIKTINHTYLTAGEYIVNIDVEYLVDLPTVWIQISSRTIEVINYELTFGSIVNRLAINGTPLYNNINPSVFKLNRTSTNEIHNIGLFQGNSNLETLEVTNWKTLYPKEIGITGDFQFCTNLKNIDINMLDGCQPIQLGSMFGYCSNLELNINDFFSNVDLSKVTTVNGLFENCSKITGSALPIISRLNHITASSNYMNCFTNCTSLSDYNLIPSLWK